MITSSITRIADHAAYNVADVVANSTTVPTAGGFTFTGACRASGGTGVITDIIITDSDDATVKLQPTVFIYNTAVTAVNDQDAFTRPGCRGTDHGCQDHSAPSCWMTAT